MKWFNKLITSNEIKLAAEVAKTIGVKNPYVAAAITAVEVVKTVVKKRRTKKKN